MAMTLRIPDPLDAKLTERAAREHRSKHDLVLEAITQANERAEVTIDTLLDDLMDTHSEILDYLK